MVGRVERTELAVAIFWGASLTCMEAMHEYLVFAAGLKTKVRIFYEIIITFRRQIHRQRTFLSF